MPPLSNSNSEGEEYSLDGSSDVLLAPVQGKDIRRSIPKDFFVKRPGVFTMKVVLALALIGAGWLVVVLTSSWWTIAPAVVLLGLMYAHLVELQHECLHEHAYKKRWVNRLVGFICGVPMLSSFSHYKYEHLRHHAYLGTEQNQEFFNYRFQNLNGPLGFIRGSFHLGRYLDVFLNISRSVVGRTNPNVIKPVSAKKIRTEYIAFALLLAGGIAFTAVTGNPVLLLLWVVPVLFVAEPTHFLIELPEHFGLNTQTNPNVLENTRTVRAGWFAKWFTNGNDLHTAHHFHQGVPMAQVPRLHEVIEERIGNTAPSYWSFYRNVIAGRLKYDNTSETCMTR